MRLEYRVIKFDTEADFKAVKWLKAYPFIVILDDYRALDPDKALRCILFLDTG